MEIRKLVLFTLVGLACCYAFTAAVSSVSLPFFAGSHIAILTYPLYALVCLPLIERAIQASIYRLRHAALDAVPGSFYDYQGIPIRVIEDFEHARWVPAAMLRKIAGVTVSDQLLAQRYPTGWQLFDKVGHLRDDALMAYLATASSTEAVKFKNWAQRNLAYPAQKTRERLGIRLEDATQ